MRVHHEIDGRGPALVLAASLGTSLEVWDEVVPALADRFQVVRFDHRGHGRTPAPPGPYTMADLAGDVIELADELGLERVSVCGLSIGGAVAMWLAANAPKRIDRLVLACTAPRFLTPEAWRERAALVREGGTEVVVDAVISRWFTPRLFDERPEVPAAFRATFCAVDREAYAGCCDALAQWDFSGELGRIAAPTLVVAAAGDTVAPPEQAEAIAAGIPDARLVVLDGAAHLAPAEQPEAFAAAVREHVGP